MKKKRAFHTDFCMACCALLMPDTKICPNCGEDNTWLTRQDDSIDDNYLNQVAEEPFAETEGEPGVF